MEFGNARAYLASNVSHHGELFSENLCYYQVGLLGYPGAPICHLSTDACCLDDRDRASMNLALCARTPNGGPPRCQCTISPALIRVSGSGGWSLVEAVLDCRRRRRTRDAPRGKSKAFYTNEVSRSIPFSSPRVQCRAMVPDPAFCGLSSSRRTALLNLT